MHDPLALLYMGNLLGDPLMKASLHVHALLQSGRPSWPTSEARPHAAGAKASKRPLPVGLLEQVLLHTPGAGWRQDVQRMLLFCLPLPTA